MSALGQSRPSNSASQLTFVRFGPKADKRGHNWIVRFVPTADMPTPVTGHRAPGNWNFQQNCGDKFI
jgi:hypothetical protein